MAAAGAGHTRVHLLHGNWCGAAVQASTQRHIRGCCIYSPQQFVPTVAAVMQQPHARWLKIAVEATPAATTVTAAASCYGLLGGSNLHHQQLQLSSCKHNAWLPRCCPLPQPMKRKQQQQHHHPCYGFTPCAAKISASVNSRSYGSSSFSQRPMAPVQLQGSEFYSRPIAGCHSRSSAAAAPHISSSASSRCVCQAASGPLHQQLHKPLQATTTARAHLDQGPGSLQEQQQEQDHEQPAISSLFQDAMAVFNQVSAGQAPAAAQQAAATPPSQSSSNSSSQSSSNNSSQSSSNSSSIRSGSSSRRLIGVPRPPARPAIDLQAARRQLEQREQQQQQSRQEQQHLLTWRRKKGMLLPQQQQQQQQQVVERQQHAKQQQQGIAQLRQQQQELDELQQLSNLQHGQQQSAVHHDGQLLQQQHMQQQHQVQQEQYKDEEALRHVLEQAQQQQQQAQQLLDQYFTSPVSFIASRTHPKPLAGSLAAAFTVHSHQLMFAAGPIALCAALKGLATVRGMLAAAAAAAAGADGGGKQSPPYNILMQPTIRSRAAGRAAYALDISRVAQLPLAPAGTYHKRGPAAANAAMVHITSSSNEHAAAWNLVQNMPARAQTVLKVAGPHAAETAVLAVALARPKIRAKYGQDLAVHVMWHANKAYGGSATALLLCVYRCKLDSFPPEVVVGPPSKNRLRHAKIWKQQKQQQHEPIRWRQEGQQEGTTSAEAAGA